MYGFHRPLSGLDATSNTREDLKGTARASRGWMSPRGRVFAAPARPNDADGADAAGDPQQKAE